MLGALMTLGIGLYAPCMILVSLLGMSERTAFPIMMGSCAFLMPVGSLRFIREQAYSFRNALGLAIGGVVGSYRRREVLRVAGHTDRPLAGDRRRPLHRHHDAAIGVERERLASLKPVEGTRRRLTPSRSGLYTNAPRIVGV